MAYQRKTFDRYRDTETKRFVSEETWNRSKAHGGTRYVRERVPLVEFKEKLAKAKEAKEEAPPKLPTPEEIEREIAHEEEEEIEYSGAFDSP